MIGFGFTPDWKKNWREFFLNQSHSVVSGKPITFQHSNENRSIWLGELEERHCERKAKFAKNKHSDSGWARTQICQTGIQSTNH